MRAFEITNNTTGKRCAVIAARDADDAKYHLNRSVAGWDLAAIEITEIGLAEDWSVRDVRAPSVEWLDAEHAPTTF